VGTLQSYDELSGLVPPGHVMPIEFPWHASALSAAQAEGKSLITGVGVPPPLPLPLLVPAVPDAVAVHPAAVKPTRPRQMSALPTIRL
jgi:hypothetical protein